MAGGNPAGEPCPSIARFGKCNKRACSYSHQLAHALSARGGGGGDATGSGGGGGGGSGKPRRGGQSALRSRFYAKSADGLLPCSLRFVDRFLRWECGRHLLGLGLFPDAKEISESVACLQAVLEHCAQHAFSPASGDTLVVCVGDGRTPRTAALVAMRSRWDCVSIDPALAGLEPPAAGEEGEGGSGDGGSSGGGECDSRCGECSDRDPAAEPLARLEKVAQARRGGGGGGAPKPLPVPKELRHANLLSQEASDAARAQRARLRTELRSIARLRLLSCRAEEAAVWVAARVTSVVVMLPHAHVTPDEALGCLRFGGERERGSAVPAIAVVQLPCCGYVWHGTALGQPPDVERLDGRICAAARTVRVWRDVSAHFNFGASARGLGARTAGG